MHDSSKTSIVVITYSVVRRIQIALSNDWAKCDGGHYFGSPKTRKKLEGFMVLPNSCLSGARRKKLQLSDWRITSHAASLDGEHHFDVLQTVDQVPKIFKNNSKLKIKTKTLVEPDKDFSLQ